jgi:hypothetical protein
MARMKELQNEFAKNDSLAETWTDALVAAITTGVHVSVVAFAEDDPDVAIAFNVLAHDVDSNRYKSTSLKNMVDVARRYKARTPGGDWPRVSKALETLYGQNKRSSAAQMSQSRAQAHSVRAYRDGRGTLHVRSAPMIWSTPGRSCTAW